MQAYILTGPTLLDLPFLARSKKLPFFSKQLFFLMYLVLVSNYHGCKGKAIKFSTILYDKRYYLQNCKAIPFEKIVNHKKYKKPNAPSI